MSADTDQRACAFAIICVDGNVDALAALRRDVREVCGSKIDVKACGSPERALVLIDECTASGLRIPLIIVDYGLPGMSGVDLLLALQQKAETRATRKALVPGDVTVSDLLGALNVGALHRLIPRPCPQQEFGESVRSLLTSFFVHHAPEQIPDFADVLDEGQFPRAYKAGQQRQRKLDHEIRTLKRSFLATMDMTDVEVDEAMRAALEVSLGHPPRRDFDAGDVLLRQDGAVDTIYILLAGSVELLRTAGGQEVVLHTQTSGRIIGLLSLAQRQRAFYTCRASTEVTVLPLNFDQLEEAVQRNPLLSTYFVTALMRSLATRSKRTAQLQVEIGDLNTRLIVERDQLGDAGIREARLLGLAQQRRG